MYDTRQFTNEATFAPKETNLNPYGLQRDPLGCLTEGLGEKSTRSRFNPSTEFEVV